MNVGIFGGSFDPVHIGHLIVAQAAADALPLNEVRFVPALEQPLKRDRHHAAAPERAAMLRLAVAGNPRFAVDERELVRPPPSYTVDTLRAIRRERPADRLFLLLGADAAADLPAWHESDAVAELAMIVVLSRPGSAVWEHPLVGVRLEVPAIDIAATTIRARRRRGASIRYLVPDAVGRYIADRGLYTEGSPC